MTEPYWRSLGRDIVAQVNDADDLALLILDLQFEHRRMAFEKNQGRVIPLSQPFGKKMNQPEKPDVEYID